jgi:hypothetical protein
MLSPGVDVDSIPALDFDLCCTVRLQEYDTEVAIANAKRTAYEVWALYVGATDQAAPTGTSTPGKGPGGQRTVEEIRL